MTSQKEKGGDNVSGKEAGAISGVLIIIGIVFLIGLFYIALVGGFNYSLEFSIKERIWAVIGIIIIIIVALALAIGNRSKNVGGIH